MLTESELKKARRLNRIYADTLIWKDGGVQKSGWSSRLVGISKLLDMTGLPNDEFGFAQAVANWQEKNGVKPIDGIIGQTTWAKMEPLTRTMKLEIDWNQFKPPGNKLFDSKDPIIIRRPGSPFDQLENRSELAQTPITVTQSSMFVPARGFLFVVFEQLPDVGKTHLIRKVAVIPNNFAFSPRNWNGTLSPGLHALGDTPLLSQYLSASNRAIGAPSIFPRPGLPAKPVLVDIAKIEAAGGKILSPDDIVRDLRQIAAKNPNMQNRINTLIDAVSKIEGEVLIEGGTPPGSGSKLKMAHKPYIQRAELQWQEMVDGKITRDALKNNLDQLDDSFRRARNLGRAGRFVSGVGLVFTAYDVTKATSQSIEQKSFKPIGAETIRQVGGWGSGVAGMKIGFVTGAALGIETGPGAIVTGAIGAIVIGGLGYWGSDWVADMIHEN